MKLLQMYHFKFTSGISDNYTGFNCLIKGLHRYSFEFSKKGNEVLLTGGHYQILTNNDPYYL